jgi:3-phenylpropionate/trans-cinnamate dioxygenase ferredoxin reductase subunit
MPAPVTVAVVGGGLAGAKTAEALRDKGFDGRVVLFADEKQLPYDRVPLSKDFLAEKTSPVARAYDEGDRRLTLPEFTVHDADWYRTHDIDLRLETQVASVDSAGHRLELADGATVGYDQLVLATGSRPSRPPIPGSDAAQAHYLRTYEDASALDETLSARSSLAVLGAGWIGLEVAASARQRGVDVTVVGRSKLPLLRTLGEEVGQIFADLHRDRAVDLRLSAQVARIATVDGVATGLDLADGSAIPTDTVLVATGAQPNIELAEAAGLTTAAGGVLVDASLRTSAPDIYAVGDVAAVEHPLLGARVRTGHWPDALKQPAVAAANIVGGSGEYADLPYFFTDQYDLGMEYVGHAPDYQRVVFRSDMSVSATGEFVAFWLDSDNRVLAGMTVNVWGLLDDIKALIRKRRPVDPERLADPGCPLSALLSG